MQIPLRVRTHPPPVKSKNPRLKRLEGKKLAMKLDEWLGDPDNVKLLTEHNEGLDRAKAHEGNPPEKRGSLSGLLGRFNFRKMEHEYLVHRQALEASFTPPMYQPCVVPLDDLEKIMIKHLRFGTRLQNSYVLVKLVNKPVRMRELMAIAKDEEDNVVLLNIRHECLPCHYVYLGEHSILLVKQPCLEWISNREFEIRVDHVSDIVFVPPFDEKVPLHWRDERFKDISEWSFDQWTDMGHRDSEKGRYGSAIAWCTNALERSPPEDHAALILSLRSEGYFQTGQYEAALRDLQLATGCPEFLEHIRRRQSRILYHLQWFQECSEVYKELLLHHPGRRSDAQGRKKAIAKLAEQKHGSYDFKEMQNSAMHSTSLLLDHATYKEPVAIKHSKLHGRGLFTTKPVRAGDLLLCEKAFSYIFEYPKSSNDSSRGTLNSNTIEVNPQTKSVTQGPLLDLTSSTIIKMHRSPSLRSKITDLHHGNFTTGTIPNDNGPVDTFLVSQIVTRNSFGSPISSHALHAGVANHLRIMAKFTCLGMWPSASYINHACVSNVRRSFIGDMMIVRAAQDLPANTELTFWYKVPSNAYLTDTSHWGFECSCALCRNVRGTAPHVRRRRVHLRARIWSCVRRNHSLERDDIEELLGELAGTYVESARVAPHFAIGDLHFAVARLFSRDGDTERGIGYAMKGFEALGFEIEGFEPRGQLLVKRWGVVIDEQVGAWVLLYLAFLEVAPKLAAMADHYARLTYRICVGEEDSFDDIYGKRSGKPYGPIDLEV